MRPEELRQLLRRQPFVAIRLHFTDGTSYEVRHPEMAFVTRSIIEIGEEEKEGSGVADKVIHCSLLHIVRVEDLNGKPPSGGNGKGKKSA